MVENKNDITDIFISEGFLSKEQLDEAINEQKLTGVSVQKILLNKNIITSITNHLLFHLRYLSIKRTCENCFFPYYGQTVLNLLYFPCREKAHSIYSNTISLSMV